MLNILDFGILIGYVLMVISVGCGAAWFQKRKAAESSSPMHTPKPSKGWRKWRSYSDWPLRARPSRTKTSR